MRVVNIRNESNSELPKRGYSMVTVDEKLIVTKRRNVDYKKFGRSLENAFSSDKHLFVELIRVSA